MVQNAFDDAGAQLGHALREPRRHTSAMQRQVSDSGAFHLSILCSRRGARPGTAAGPQEALESRVVAGRATLDSNLAMPTQVISPSSYC
jgi:hypothetical protein